MTRELEVASGGTEGRRHPAALDPIHNVADLPKNPKAVRPGGEVDAMLVIRIEPVVVEIYRDDVRHREFLHTGLCMIRTMEDERN